MSLDSAILGATSSTPRLPFRFPFDPPSTALPLSQPSFLTPSYLTPSQLATGVGGTVKLLAALMGTGAVMSLFSAPLGVRQWQFRALKKSWGRFLSQQRVPLPEEEKHSEEADPTPAMRSPAHAEEEAGSASSSSSSSHPISELTSSAETGAVVDSLPERLPTPSSPARLPTPDYDAQADAAADEMLSRSARKAKRRTTMAPEFSHIDEITHKPKTRKSLGRSPMKNRTPEKAAQVKREGPRRPPFKLGLITPTSLKRYGELLAAGFEELIAKQGGSSGSEDTFLIGSVELCLPKDNESANAFAMRIRDTKDFDVLLVQYHGSFDEEPICFFDFSEDDSVPTILLLHRPEEILHRHHRKVFKATQYNVINLLQDVDVVVLLGEAARPTLLKQLPAATPANVCVVPHGFTQVPKGDDGLQQLQRKQLGPIVVVGAHTTWGEMRWLADLVQLRHSFEEKLRLSKGKDAQRQILLYAAGSFVSYTHPFTKEPVNELDRLQDVVPELLHVVAASELEKALSAGKIIDEVSLKKYLWALSEQGKKVVVCTGDMSEKLRGLHDNLFDFNTQLYREVLSEWYAPKVEYSGSLHSRPGSSIPVVFDSPSMSDVEIEGLQLIMVPYEKPDAIPDMSEVSKEMYLSPGKPSHISSPSFSNSATPWYLSRSFAPNFEPAVEQVLHYLRQPTHFHAHRINMAQAAQQLTMRHVAGQYESIIEQLSKISK